jgi:hypothetical protein
MTAATPPAGSPTLRIGAYDIPGPVLVGAASSLAAVIVLVAYTGEDGFTALWTGLAFVGGLALLGSFTRTVSLVELRRLFTLGAGVLGLAILGTALFEQFEPDRGATSRTVVVPLIEETLKLAPVLLFAWRARRGRTWTLGATDLLLLGAASGAGFAVIEDAFIRNRFGWPDSLSLLPVAESVRGRVIAGHGVWSAISGAGIGFGLLLRSRGRIAWVVGLSGYAWSVFDHIGNNYDNGTRGDLADFLSTLRAHGSNSIYIFVAFVVAAIVADALLVSRTLPKFEELQPPASGQGVARLLDRWRFVLKRRQLALAGFQFRRASPSAQAQLEPLVEAITGQLIDAHFAGSAPSLSVGVEAASPSD